MEQWRNRHLREEWAEEEELEQEPQWQQQRRQQSQQAVEVHVLLQRILRVMYWAPALALAEEQRRTRPVF